MSHYAVNTGRAEDPHPAPHPLGDLARDEGAPTGRRRRGAAVRARHRDQPRARPRRPGRPHAVDRGPHRPVRAARLRAVPHPALRIRGRRRSPSSRSRRGRTRMPEPGRPDSPRTIATRTTCRPSRSGCRCSCSRYFAFAQFKRSAIPNGPKVSPAGSLSPRGDWRAPSDGNARAWLAELKAALPELVEESSAAPERRQRADGSRIPRSGLVRYASVMTQPSRDRSTSE